MASRLTSFLSERRGALVSSAVAAIFCLVLYSEWQDHEVREAHFSANYSKLAQYFSAGDLDRLAPSGDFVVMFAVLTGFAIAFALGQWRQGPR